MKRLKTLRSQISYEADTSATKYAISSYDSHQTSIIDDSAKSIAELSA